MNRRATLLSQSLLLTFFLFPNTSCRQGEGERCELNSDCSSGLTCDISVGGGSSNGVNGICRSSTSTPTTTVDAAVKLDTRITLDTKADHTALEAALSSDGLVSDGSPSDAISIDGQQAMDVLPATDATTVDRPVILDSMTDGDKATDVPFASDTVQDQALPSDATDGRLD